MSKVYQLYSFDIDELERVQRIGRILVKAKNPKTRTKNLSQYYSVNTKLDLFFKLLSNPVPFLTFFTCYILFDPTIITLSFLKYF
jgi:hypothetical protein